MEKIYHRHALSTMWLLYHVLQWFCWSYRNSVRTPLNHCKTWYRSHIVENAWRWYSFSIFRQIRDFWNCVWAQNPCGNLNVFHLSFGFLMVVGFSFFCAKLYHRHAFSTMWLLYRVLQWFCWSYRDSVRTPLNHCKTWYRSNIVENAWRWYSFSIFRRR